jgi:crotonobetainyl-CoA:carnitine CoA-transferase CaiB-like acyl-CoA transferase
VVVYTDRHWRAFADIVGVQDLFAPGSVFLNMESRTIHAQTIGAFLAEQLLQRSNAEWLAVLDAADIPACPVNSIDDLYSDPHLRAVGLFQPVPHPTEGALLATRFPVKFSRSPATLRRMVPNLGEHGGAAQSREASAGDAVPGAAVRPAGGAAAGSAK